MNRNSAVLICCIATLLALGAVMGFSVIGARASSLPVGLKYLFKHLLWVSIGVAGLLALRRFDYHKLENWQWPLAFAAVALLILVRVPGIGTLKNGAWRWLRVGPVGFQPSEVAKIALLVTVSAMAARRGAKMGTLVGGLLPCMAVVGIAAGLILIEPDFGTAALIGGMGTCVVLAAGAPILPIAAVCLAGASGLAVLVMQSPTRLARVFAYLDPWQHHDAAGYQVVHSLLSLGCGGFFGRGLGAGRQKLGYLPEADTDFIFAVIGEELGLIGALGVLFLFVLIVRQGLKISAAARDSFGALLAFGITCMIAMQALIHVAVVTASMPTKGIALPFVSAGGSSMVISLAAAGILLNVAAQGSEAPAPAVAPATAEGRLYA